MDATRMTCCTQVTDSGRDEGQFLTAAARRPPRLVGGVARVGCDKSPRPPGSLTRGEREAEPREVALQETPRRVKYHDDGGWEELTGRDEHR